MHHVLSLQQNFSWLHWFNWWPNLSFKLLLVYCLTRKLVPYVNISGDKQSISSGNLLLWPLLNSNPSPKWEGGEKGLRTLQRGNWPWSPEAEAFLYLGLGQKILIKWSIFSPWNPKPWKTYMSWNKSRTNHYMSGVPYPHAGAVEGGGRGGE